MKKKAIALFGLSILCIMNLPPSSGTPDTEAGLGLGLGSGFFRIGAMRQTHELALRYFFTSDVFSAHLDDNKGIGALVYLTIPPKSRSVFFRLGIGVALCFLETARAKSKAAIGLPLDAQAGFYIGRHVSLGAFACQTITSLKKYAGVGITLSIYL